MKKSISFAVMAASFNLSAQVNVSIIGRPITSPLKDQVCHILTNKGQETCSGVRISKDYVLTAQHCVRGTDGKSKVINFKLTCNDINLNVEKVYESEVYAKNLASAEFIKQGSDKKSHLDFALLKLKNPSDYIPKVKLLNNFAEYKSVFLESSDQFYKKFNENTDCEMHGFGTDAKGRIDIYHSAAISSTTKYNGADYFIEALERSDYAATIRSPYLPEENSKLDWVYSMVRPGDSGGPLFCKARSGEWVLSGIASILAFNECPDSMQNPDRKWYQSKLKCGQNEWGLPTKEALEKIVGAKIP
ncbi:MAG: trypsin-like serine protease [Bdellovibrionales bacterium]|nr:trypsin-like serine protease [Bdellovibrionales bacterium]